MKLKISWVVSVMKQKICLAHKMSDWDNKNDTDKSLMGLEEPDSGT